MQKTVLRDWNRGSFHSLFHLVFLLCALPIMLAACSADTGVFAGGSWQSSGLVHQHIRTLAIDSNNPQFLYAGDLEGKVFASSDGGQHWAERNAGLPVDDALRPVSKAINALSFDATGKKLYAATAGGLFVSTDAAQRWNNVEATATGLTTNNFVALAFDLNAPHTIYIAASNDIFVSQNDGHTWSSIGLGRVLTAGSSVNSLTFDTDNHQLWAATTSGVYRFDSKKAAWQILNAGLPGNSIVYAIQPASTSGGAPNLIFAGTNQGFYRSEDAGAHWAESQQSLARTSVRSLFVDFRHPVTVYAGTGVGVLRSDNSGQNWGGIGPGLPRNQPVYALLLGASNYAELYAVTDDVYMFPGSSQFSITRLLPILFVVLLFYLLYRLTRRNRRGKQNTLKPERIIEQPHQTEELDRSTPGNLP
ncbi:MAG TPA: hypothetical protein VEU97_01015 [Ktedonobacteraceae bacterium]|nr:hypothetical protein [Ktedonobacteraceae bacterium]